MTREYSLYSQFTRDLSARWDVDDEGDVTDLLGVDISVEDDCICLRQTQYITKLVSEHAPNGIPPAFQRGSPPCTHEFPQLVLEAMTSTEQPVDPLLLRRYQSLVGALLYCSTNSRPDIAYAVNVLCRAMSRPTPELMDAAMRVLYYLHVHREISLRYQADDKAIKGYVRFRLGRTPFSVWMALHVQLGDRELGIETTEICFSFQL